MKTIAAILTLSLALNSFAASSAPPSHESAFQDARAGKTSELSKKLTKLDINKRNDQGQTLLMAAASQGHEDTVQLLLKHKADVNVVDTEGGTALLMAIYNEQTTTAKTLIEAGTNLSIINSNGESALIAATSTNNIEIIKLILAKDKKQINLANKDGEIAIMKAAKVGSLETVQILVKAGADLKAKDHLGRTAFDIAKKSQNTDALKYLKPKK